jgi:cell division protein FtsQ
MSDADIMILPGDRPGPSRPTGQKRPAQPKAKAAAKPAKRAAAKPAPRPARRPRLGLTPLQKIGGGGLAALALATGIAILWHSGAPARLAGSVSDGVLAATARAGLKLDRIVVHGRDRTTNAEILAALGVRAGTPILGIDLGQARDRLDAIPSVADSRIERRLPGTLTVALTERRPVAVWQRPDGAFVLIDRLGHPIPGPVSGYGALPQVVGPGAAKATAALLDMLATEPALAGRVKAAVRVGERRWTLFLDKLEGGLVVKLPENGAETAWHRLARLEDHHGLTRRGIGMVDMRLPDRMILRLRSAMGSGDGKDGHAPRRQANGA